MTSILNGFYTANNHGASTHTKKSVLPDLNISLEGDHNGNESTLLPIYIKKYLIIYTA